jgi:ABC-type lipoprotein release transport system permease subunit
MFNLCRIVADILKMATTRNFSMSGIISLGESSYDSRILLDPLLSSQSLNRDLNRGHVRLGSSEWDITTRSSKSAID